MLAGIPRGKNVVRVAAIADVHCKVNSKGQLRQIFAEIAAEADILVICGDITDSGIVEEASVFIEEIKPAVNKIPVLAVLGNHDFESGNQDAIGRQLADSGVIMLDGNSCEIYGIGFTGVKGFGGGFGARALQAWGETAIKNFVEEVAYEKKKLEQGLSRLNAGPKIVAMHYAPIRDTVAGEPPEIFPFLGSSSLEDPLNRFAVTAIFHGHAHKGSFEGITGTKVPVYNVSIAVLKKRFPTRSPYFVLEVPVRNESKSKTVRGFGMEEAESEDMVTDAKVDFYRRSLKLLKRAKISFLVGGAYALHHYTGIFRDTKDLDVFIKPADSKRTLDAFAAAGFETALTFEHWLAKATWNGHLVDIIFNSGNSISEVDDIWFQRATDGNLFGVNAKFVPPEEMIWSKAFVMERERYDGADVNHILLACGKKIDWRRLLDRFGPYKRVLLSHLVLFGFVYPAERRLIPQWVMDELISHWEEDIEAVSDNHVCLGTLLSREQYSVDINRMGFIDPRLPPHGKMTEEQVRKWDAGSSTDGFRQKNG